MKIAERFRPDFHYRELCSWAKAWELPEPSLDILPRCGRIVPGHCAVFVYQTDSKIGFIENLISNPEVSGDALTESIDACVKSIEADASEMGITCLAGSIRIDSVIYRAERLGYQVDQGQRRMIYKRIG